MLSTGGFADTTSVSDLGYVPPQNISYAVIVFATLPILTALLLAGWYQTVEEMTGVKIDVNFVPTLSYVDKITAFIASKTLPMVFTANSSVLKNNNLLMALDRDGFWALDDYIRDYPELYNFIGEQVWENSKIHGKIYGIPRLRILPRNGAIIRQDWLDNLGLEAPETFDELYEVAKAFTENDPDGNGVADSVGIVTAYQGAGNRGWNGFQTLATAFGAPNGWAYVDGEMWKMDPFRE